MNTSCVFCGMPPRDGEGCCTSRFKSDTMRRADRDLKALRAELAALRAAAAAAREAAIEECAKEAERMQNEAWSLAAQYGGGPCKDDRAHDEYLRQNYNFSRVKEAIRAIRSDRSGT